MKACSFLMLLSTLLSFSATAQKIAPEAVPKAISIVFIKDFPGVTGEWELIGGRYIATFEQNKYKMQTVYNAAGARLETHVIIKEEELPEAARVYMSHYYPTIDEASKIILANDHVSFKVLAGAKYYEFDKQGNYLGKAAK